MTVYQYGEKNASVILLQPVGEHDIAQMDEEVAAIHRLTKVEFGLLAVKVNDWNRELSPWPAPAVFGKEAFGEGAEGTLKTMLQLCQDRERKYYIGGYSLAGLFSLWASYQTDVFTGVAAASPSMWFPGFLPYMREHKVQTQTVYLSLGDREERTKNPVMSTVGDCIREAHEYLVGQGTDCMLEWNAGNHFRDPELRTAKAFAHVMELEF